MPAIRRLGTPGYVARATGPTLAPIIPWHKQSDGPLPGQGEQDRESSRSGSVRARRWKAIRGREVAMPMDVVLGSSTDRVCENINNSPIHNPIPDEGNS
jgi:hypothetical protein